MQNSNNIGSKPMGPNTIELPLCSLVETLSDCKLALKAKRDLTEIFTTFILLTDQGDSLGSEHASDLFYLYTGLHELMDAIILQSLQKAEQ